MTYDIRLIEHTDTIKKERFLRLIDLMAVYEQNGFIQKIVTHELEQLGKGQFETPFHIAAAYTSAGALVGYSFYYPCESTCEFYVLPHWRKKGIGTALVKAIRDNWSGTKVLSAYRGFEGWAEFFESQFILELDQFETISKENIDKYGDPQKALAALKKVAKLEIGRRVAKAKRQAIKDAV